MKKPIINQRKWLTFSAMPSRILSTSLLLVVVVHIPTITWTMERAAAEKRQETKYKMKTAKFHSGELSSHLLSDSYGNIVPARRIIPADVLPHHWLEEFHANARDLSHCRIIEAIHTKYASYHLQKCRQRYQYAVSYWIVDNFLTILFPRGICAAEDEGELKGIMKNKIIHWLSTYSTWPPPNQCSANVSELVPSMYVRSTSNVVNSPYTTIMNGIASDFKNVNITPRMINIMSQVDA